MVDSVNYLAQRQGARAIYQGAGFTLAGKQKHSSCSRRNLVAETWQRRL